VSELTVAGHHHRDAVDVGGRDHLGVPNRAAGLDDRGDARGGGLLDAIGDRLVTGQTGVNVNDLRVVLAGG
jgi:hypothetical protein